MDLYIFFFCPLHPVQEHRVLVYILNVRLLVMAILWLREGLFGEMLISYGNFPYRGGGGGAGGGSPAIHKVWGIFFAPDAMEFLVKKGGGL